jgi:hypothetical protein
MGIETRGRPRADGERYPGGKLKPAARVVEVPPAPAATGHTPISGALWQRMLADGEKLFRDAKFGTELTRLGAVGQLTPSEVATGIRVAGVYGRFEYYRNQRRSAASPHYIREFISEGAGSDTEAVNFRAKEGRERDRSFNPDSREVREQDAVAAFKALQEILPAEVRAQLEMLCVEDRHVGYQGLIRARIGLAIAKEHFSDEAKGLSKKDRRLLKMRGRIKLAPAPKPKVVAVNSFKDAFMAAQRVVSPHLTDDELDHVWGTICALKARSDFRQEKSERAST